MFGVRDEPRSREVIDQRGHELTARLVPRLTEPGMRGCFVGWRQICGMDENEVVGWMTTRLEDGWGQGWDEDGWMRTRMEGWMGMRIEGWMDGDEGERTDGWGRGWEDE